MTKGKYAARSALRREDADVRGDIETYQRAVARLTEENRRLREQVQHAEQLRKTETRTLRAERDEGLSPEIVALRSELQRQRARADSAVSRARDTGLFYKDLFTGLRGFFVAIGFSERESQEILLMLEMPEDMMARVEPEVIAGRRAVVGATTRAKHNRVLAVQAARGQRHAGDVVALVREKVLAALEKE